MKKLVIWSLVVVVMAAAAWWYFGSDTDSAASSFDMTRRGVATSGDLTVSISAVGTVQPIHAVEIKSKASGEIIELAVDEGDVVQKGDLLIRLDRRTVQNEYDQAEADYEVAKVTLEQREKELNRQRGLYEKKLISETEYDAARLAHEQANSQFVRAGAALSTSEERLQDTEIRSPIEGLVLSRSVEEGQIISSGTSSVTGGTLLYIIADMSRVNVITDVDETDIGQVSTGLGARVVADAYPEKKFDGRVIRIAPLAKVEQNVTMFEVTVLVDNEDGLLKAGMNTDVEMVIDEALNTVLVPLRAVQTRMKERPKEMDSTMRAERRQAMGMDSTARAEWRSRMGTDSTAHDAAGNPEMAGRFSGRRGGRIEQFVQVIENGETVDRPVRVGLTNLDYAQIIDGVQPGDSVVWTLTSGAMAGREEFMERMRNRSAVPGMRR